LFEDLGMTSSTYIKETDDHDNMPNRALGYFYKDKETRPFNNELLKYNQFG